MSRADWEAEARVGEDLARELVAEQFGPLPRRSVKLLAEGWDYVVQLVDGEWAFRFPRRAVVVPGTEREIAVLGLLAPHLPIGAPAPTHVGRPTERYPWPFFGARFLPGIEAGEAMASDEERVRLARPLARALRALHAPKVLAEVGGLLPFDPIHRADMTLRVPRTRDELAAVGELGTWQPPQGVDELLDRAAALPQPEPRAVCHGDLHFRQLLVDRGELSGIIDWVDVCRSDPGVDLQLVWSCLPPTAREGFLDEYGPVTGESLLRARVLALFLNAVLVRYGRAEGMPTVTARALAGLRRASAGL
jgi:aminoglycoside phosphotransferase (APT) family kinase protein